MKKRKKWFIIPLTLITLLFVSMGICYPAIKTSYLNMIQVAYMNGFMTALRLDVEKIKKIKKDRVLLEQTVKKSSERYVEKVYQMNLGQ